MEIPIEIDHGSVSSLQAQIFEHFRNLTQNRIAILISHRFSTVRMADQIIVIRDGRISRPALGVSSGPEGLTQALKLPKGVPLVAVAPGPMAADPATLPWRKLAQGIALRP